MADAVVRFPNGSLTVAQLASAFAAITGDVTFVDADGIVRYYSEYRIFERPPECLGRHVLACHSEGSRAGIERLLSEFATGWRDDAVFLEQKAGRSVQVRYLAVRDAEGSYQGCLEIAQWAGD